MTQTPTRNLETQNEILTAEDEIDSAINQSGLKEKQKLKRKKQMKYALIGLGLLLVSYLVYWGFKPFKGSMSYGVCKVFLELQVRYPTSLRLSTVQESGNWVRIWYARTDSFGQFITEPIQCYFTQDPERGTILEKVTIRRLPVPQEKIDSFNKTIAIVAQSEIDLTLPSRLPKNIDNLQFNTDQFRRQLNIIQGY